MTNLNTQFLEYIQAGYAAFYLHTAETSRVTALLHDVNQSLNFKLREYDLAYGQLNPNGVAEEKLADPSLILQRILNLDFEEEIIYIRGIKTLLEHNPLALNRLRHLIEKITYKHKGECILVLQDSELYLPAEIEPFITLLTLPLPKENEIKALIKDVQIQVEPDILAQLTTALSGLNELEIKQLLQLIKNRFNTISATNKSAIFEEIQQQKEQIIAKSGVLEMVKAPSSIEDIGGLENLKNWVKDQSYILANLEQAKKFGVKAPKGTLIVGMPGCGKSLTAKATATLFQQPLLRLDIGSLLGKYVGESETNMRKALAMAESISPCVLWVDELEKAFVGMSGDNASEVSSRLLGYFLTWLQEKTTPVFIVATANDITALPPELLRKGRFDEIFYVGFPNTKERKQILEIHLKKAQQQVENFDLAALARQCKDYSGADIENAVFEGVKQAFIKKEPKLTALLLETAIKNTHSLRKTLKDKVGEYEKKFDEFYLTNASLDDGLSIAQMNKMADDDDYLKRIKVAESDEVTDDILEKLADDTELRVRKAVFSNPNCPAKLLSAELVKDKRDEIAKLVIKHKNLSFDLALDYLSQNTGTGLEVEFTQNPNILDNLDKFLKSTNEVKYQYINQHLLNDELQNQFIPTTDEKLQLCIFQKNTLSDNLSDQAQKILAKHSAKEIRLALSKKANLSLKTEEILAQDSDADVRKSLASNPNLSTELMAQLAQDSDSDVRKSLASNLNLSTECMAILAQDSNSDVIKSLANNPNLSTELMAKLVGIRGMSGMSGIFFDYIGVRKCLASNPNSSAELMATLAQDSNSDVREFLAQNLNLPAELMAKLAQDSNSDVIKSLARNPNLSAELMAKLAQDSYPSVVESLASNPNLSAELMAKLAQDSNSDVRKRLADNPNLSAEVMTTLAQDSDADVRKRLADNPNLSAECMAILAQDSSWQVRGNLASNPNLSAELMAKLAQDSDSCVRYIAKENPMYNKL